MFWIGFTEEPLWNAEPEEDGRVGLLVLKKHEERFVTHFSTWSQKQYIDHWTSALIRVLSGKPSALVTDMRKPSESSHLVWWPMWEINGEIVFHNQLLFFEQHKLQNPDLDGERLYDLVGERQSFGNDGTPVSEWTVPVNEVEAFILRTQAR